MSMNTVAAVMSAFVNIIMVVTTRARCSGGANSATNRPAAYSGAPAIDFAVVALDSQ
jgi:hypothetical protein